MSFAVWYQAISDATYRVVKKLRKIFVQGKFDSKASIYYRKRKHLCKR